MKTTAIPVLALAALITASATRGSETDDLLAKAKDGDAGAQYTIGVNFAKGDGVPKDPMEAVKWLTKSAEQGNGDAQLSLGGLYLGEQGIPKNSAESAKWFQLAAEQGKIAAQVQMARMHLAGTGVKQDDVQAYKWAKLAWLKRDRQANRILVYLRSRMTALQIAQAEKLATEFLARKTAEDAARGIPSTAPPLE